MSGRKPETTLKRAVLRALNRLPGVCAWNSPSGHFHGRGGYVHGAPGGTPDLIGYLPGGTMLALEVKRPGELPSQVQLDWGKRAVRAGVRYAVVTSVSEAMRVATG